MDMIWLIDRLGEPVATIAVGAIIGLIFGVFAERSGFCTRSAVIETVNGRVGKQLPLWLIGFATAIFGMQLLLHLGMVDVTETRFFSNPQSLSGALIGGALFGVGMILARGCASRLLVLGSAGNLRALFAIAVLAVTAYLTLEGFGSGLRGVIAGGLSTSAAGGNDLLALTALPQITGVYIGAGLLAIAAAAAIIFRLPLVYGVAGIAIGAIIPLGWYLSYSLSIQLFDPIQADSLSYIRPFSNWIALLGSGFSETYFSVDIGLVAGTVIGALLASLLFGSFRVQGFGAEGSAPFWRYLVGAVLMGFGGVLAAGCTIGAGFTGGSVLALASLTALAAMVLSAALAHRLIDARSPVPSAGRIQPAE